jgi:hypothetical protein
MGAILLNAPPRDQGAPRERTRLGGSASTAASEADPAELPDHAAADEVTPGPIGAWLPPNARDLRLDEPEPDTIPTDIDPAEPAF